MLTRTQTTYWVSLKCFLDLCFLIANLFSNEKQIKTAFTKESSRHITFIVTTNCIDLGWKHGFAELTEGFLISLCINFFPQRIRINGYFCQSSFAKTVRPFLFGKQRWSVGQAYSLWILRSYCDTWKKYLCKKKENLKIAHHSSLVCISPMLPQSISKIWYEWKVSSSWIRISPKMGALFVICLID